MFSKFKSSYEQNKLIIHSNSFYKCELNSIMMKRITVTIPDNKESLFIELMKNISFVKNVETTENTDIPEWHKTIIDRRMENYKKNPESFRDWEDLQKEINQKYGL